MTIKRILCGCAMLALAVGSASAQTKYSISGACSKPDLLQTVPINDQPGHVFLVQQGKCVPKGEVAGTKSKEGVFTEHGEITGDHIKTSGIYAETYESGDKIFYNYQLSATTKDGALQSGKGTFQVRSGTGKMKGIKASGTCIYTSGTDGGSNYACEGQYTQAGAKMAK